MASVQKELQSTLTNFAAAAVQRGELLVIVGGYLRDLVVLNKEGRDIDLLYTGDAIDFALELSNQSPIPTVKVREIFEPFRTAKIEVTGLEEYNIEIASCRTETYVEPASFPKIKLCQQEDRLERIQVDLPRRDFTINAIVAEIATPTSRARNDAHCHPERAHCHPERSEGSLRDSIGVLHYVQDDTINTQQDITNKQIRIFHDNSFIDDPTRIYRAVRFAAKLGFKFEANTYEVMRAACRDPRFPEWLQKRKNRFNIELNLIESLEPAKAKIAIDLLAELLPPK